jgi:hypothetical protein
MAVLLSQPLAVVAVLEGLERCPQLDDAGEAADPEELLLERANESFRDPVPFRLADVGGAARDAEEGELVLVVVRGELAAMVVNWLPWSWRSASPAATSSA